jgi:hypothetical protein
MKTLTLGALSKAAQRRAWDNCLAGPKVPRLPQGVEGHSRAAEGTAYGGDWR